MPESNSDDHCDIISTTTDPLNGIFERASSIIELTSLYLNHADLFHLDRTSGGDRERQEQYIKFIITLLSPKED